MSIFANIGKVPELRRRILFTLGMLAVYRIGIFVTTPGVDRNVMKSIVADQGASFLGMFNMFSGGALEQLSIFALGIMPYVSASIILQLMTVVVKPLEELRKEGEAGQRKINQYTRYGTIVISIVQSTGLAMYFEGLNGSTQYGDVGARAGLGLPPDDHDLADHRHRIHHVAGRADQRARHRQRHVDDHLRRHRARICRTRCSSTASLLKTSESLQPVDLLLVVGHLPRHRVGHLPRRARPAPHPDPLRAPHGRAARCTAVRPRTCRCA